MAGTEIFTSPVPAFEEPFGPWLWTAAKERIIKGRLHLVQGNGDDIWVEPVQTHVISVGIDFHGEVDKEAFDQWLRGVFRDEGTDVFRYMGILALLNRDQPYVFQGTHSWFEGRDYSRRTWQPAEQRRCKINLIGKNLNREELVSSFKKCLVS